MAGHRTLYLTALVCGGMFYLAYGEWLSGVILLVLLGLPWLSLLVSLPAIAGFRFQLQGPDAVTIGDEAELLLVGASRFPMLPFRGRIRLTDPATGQTRRYPSELGLPTAHCGSLLAAVEKLRLCDYLGLFTIPVRRREQKTILIRPRPLPVPDAPPLNRYTARIWRPKPGGYAEKHELRLYRPGDGLNQVHWKLSAKTGRLIVREPMEPQRGLILLTMNLRGTPEERDRKFGRLLWLGRWLLEQETPFELRALTGEGIRSFPISEAAALDKAIDALLRSPLAREGSIRDRVFAASWQYHVGGAPDEVQ